MRKLILLFTFIILSYSLCAETLAQQSFEGISKNANWDQFTGEKTTTRSTAPIVSNLTVSQRTDGSKLVDIYYDLFDANNDLCEINFKLSSDDGATYNVQPTAGFVSGDFGADISSGVGKHIVWDAGAESFELDGSYLYRVYAEDGSAPQIPANFVFVQGGSISTPGSTWAGIFASDFYIDKYELTNAEWNAVMGSGGGDNNPKVAVSWFNAIEYCNRRSMQEGLPPCYSYLTYGTNPDNWPTGWYTDYNNAVNVFCEWIAIGYRLPTEAEWEYAARGGLQTHGYTYSGSNDINLVGWCWPNSYGFHLVGQLAPNELGAFDMSGNIDEWCWDGWDPTGSKRVVRGGHFGDNADGCTVSYRKGSFSETGYTGRGFRICRVSP